MPSSKHVLEEAVRLDLGVGNDPYQRKTVSRKKRGRNKTFEQSVYDITAPSKARKVDTSTSTSTTQRVPVDVDPLIMRLAMRRATQKQRKKHVKTSRKEKAKDTKRKSKVKVKRPTSEPMEPMEPMADEEKNIDIQDVVGVSSLREDQQQAVQNRVSEIANRDLAYAFVEEYVTLNEFGDNIRAVIETTSDQADDAQLEDMVFEALQTAATEIDDTVERRELAKAAMEIILNELIEETGYDAMGEERAAQPPAEMQDQPFQDPEMEGVEEAEGIGPVPMETEAREARRQERKAKIQRIFQVLSKKYKGEKAEAAAREEEELNAFIDQFAQFAHTGEGGFAGYKLSVEKLLNEGDVLSPARCLFINNRLLREIEERGTIVHDLEREGKPFVNELRMFEYVKEKQVEFLARARETHPSLIEARSESDDEFMARFQRLLNKHNKIVQSTDFKSPLKNKNDSAALLIEDQVKQEYSRFESLKYSIGEKLGKMQEYINELIKEKAEPDGFKDIKEYELARKLYDKQRNQLGEVYNEFLDTNDEFQEEYMKDWNKMWKLSNTFVKEMEEAKPLEVWKEVSQTIRAQVNEDDEKYSRQMQERFNKDLREIGDLLFQPYETPPQEPEPTEGEERRYYFTAYENYRELFNHYMKLRHFFMNAAENDWELGRAKWDVYNQIGSEIEWMLRSMQTNKVQLRDPHKIEKELENREQLLSGVLQDQDKALRQMGRERTEYQQHDMRILENIDESRKRLKAEWTTDQLTYKLIFKQFPTSWTEAISGLEEEVTELRRRVQSDISAFGPFLSHTISNIWEKFSQKIQNVRPDEREQFMTAVEAEKKFLFENISNEAYRLHGSKLHKAAASGIDSLQNFVMDPSSFTPKDKTQMVNDTSIGLYMSNTRRLLNLIDQAMRLRQRMVSEPYRIMGMEGAQEAPKFDMVLTHLFPPSQVELKLRFLMQLSDRKKYENGPFIKSIKMLFPDFDLSMVSNESFVSQVAEISQASKEFLKTVVGSTPIAWSDFENQADELTRLEYEILSQVEDKPIENDPTRQNNQEFQPTDAPPYDRDAGAVMNDAGLRVNPTFNPVTQGQITRDAIDDAKRVSYIQIAGSLASVFLDPPDSTDPYVPLHVGPAKFFFSKDNYKALGDQFDSMRPLQPKQTVNDPNGKIEEILSRYGKFLGIKKRATQRTDHPILVQQEAIELTEFVNAFKAYGQQTAGNYVHPVDGATPSNGSGPQASMGPPTSTSTNATKDDDNVDPNDTGESTSDPLISGLRAAYQSAPRAPGGGGQVEDNGNADASLWGSFSDL